MTGERNMSFMDTAVVGMNEHPKRTLTESGVVLFGIAVAAIEESTLLFTDEKAAGIGTLVAVAAAIIVFADGFISGKLSNTS